jgi:hypothetical protein
MGLQPAISEFHFGSLEGTKAVCVSIFHSKIFFLKKTEYKVPNLMMEGVDANFCSWRRIAK